LKPVLTAENRDSIQSSEKLNFPANQPNLSILPEFKSLLSVTSTRVEITDKYSEI